jgi:hypothetical protein
MRGRATELAGSIAAGVKRRQAARAPKALLFDEAGRPRTLDPASAQAQALIATARAMVDVAGPDETDAVDAEMSADDADPDGT